MVLLGVGLSGLLVGYNLITNRTPTPDGTYLVRNLVVGASLVAGAVAAGLPLATLGLDPGAAAAGLRWGGLVVTAAAVVAAVAGALADRVAPIAHALDDRRADLPPQRLGFQVFVRIPLGTALFEEVAFRGVLLAVFAEAMSTGWAVVASSTAFGLWHLGPTRLAAAENDVSDPTEVRRRIAVAVVVTTVGGVGFALLRLVSDSIVAPVVAHAAINGFALLVAAVRRAP